MDAVTLFISSMHVPLLTEASILLNDFPFFIAALLVSLALIKPLQKNKRVLPALLGVFILIFLSTSLKALYKEARPCSPSAVEPLASKVPCPAPPDYSFPSGHVALAFLLIAAGIGTEAFPAFFALGIFSVFSRINLGVHYTNDVIAGVVLGIVAYAIAEKIVFAMVGE